MTRSLKEKFIGDRAFYRAVCVLLFPLVIQNVITNFVGLIDNIMVGRIGTEPMSGVAIVNRFVFVYNLAVFGIQSGAGIFTAQFNGKGDNKGIADTFRIRMAVTFITFAVGLLVFLFKGEALIDLFLHQSTEDIDLAATMMYGKQYLAVALWGMLPFGILSAYAGTLRETGNSKVPMVTGLIAVFTNVILNYVLIYGKLGLPAMGVRGAALATVISRLVDMAILIVWTHGNPEKNPFVKDLFGKGPVKPELIWKILKTSLPLFLNEFMWSLGITITNQSMSLRGIDVVSAINISNVIVQVFMCCTFAMGTTISIIVGQDLGSGDLDKAVDDDNKLLALELGIAILTAIGMILVSSVIPMVYNTTAGVKALATKFIIISAIMTPFNAMMHGTYFTLRSGGKALITMLFDSGFVWSVSVPLSLILSRLTDMTILPMYTILYGADIIKMIIGLRLVHKKSWVNNLVKNI